MSFLRSPFLGLIVSLVLLAGYAGEVAGDCCAHAEDEQAEHGKAGAGNDDCQCICHQALSPCTVVPVSVAAVLMKPSRFLPRRDEFPPDSLPLGIEYPPQLA